METTNETEFASKTLKDINDICARYDKLITHLEPRKKQNEEERRSLKEATQKVIAELEKHEVPKAKQIIFVIRTLNLRMQSLIEKCQRVFPQLEELVRLKSLQTEIDGLLNKVAATTSPLPNCPMCQRFGGYHLFAKGAGEDENIFLYVAEKIAASGKGTPGGRRARSRSSGSSGSCSGSGSLSARGDDDEFIIGGRRRRKPKTLRRKSLEPAFRDIEVRHYTVESDTQAEVTPTIPSDPSRELREEDKEKRKNLLWLEDDLDVDVPESHFLYRRSRRPSRHTKKRRGSRRRARSADGRTPSTWNTPVQNEQTPGTPEKTTPCIFCALPDSKHKAKDASPSSPAMPPSTPPATPTAASPTPTPTSAERPVDFIVSATVGAPPGLSVQVQEKSPSSNRACLLQLVAVICALNVVVSFLTWLWGVLTSTNSWPGSMLWPFYCKAANRLCKDDYNFACTDYCASRLERFMWGKK